MKSSLSVLLIFVLLCVIACSGGGNSDNFVPVADAGVDQSVETGAEVTLDASLSSDPDSDTLTYAWTLESSPFNSTAILDNNSAQQPVFTVDKAGNYVFSLVVNDGSVDSVADTVTVTASASWKTPVRIDTDTGASDALEAQVAGDGAGNFVAVWQQGDGPGPSPVINIWANTYDASTKAWGTAVKIESSLYGAYSPQIAVDGAGNAVVVWWQQELVNFHIWANTYDASTEKWGTPVVIETDPDMAWYPQVGIDGDGNAICLWRQDDGGVSNIWANKYDATTKTWGTAEEVEAVAQNSYHPQVAVDSTGNAVAVWIQEDGALYNIWASTYDALTETWGTAELIETEDLGIALLPQIAMDGSGNAMVIWQQSDGTPDGSNHYNIWTNTYTAATKTWGTAETIETSDENANYPQIAMNGTGAAVAVWYQADGVTGRNKIFANSYSKITGWGTATRIEADSGPTSNNLMNPQVAIDAAGNAVAVWTWYAISIRSNFFDAATGTWGEAAQTAGVGGADEYVLPQVAMDNSGEALLVWGRNIVQANSYW